jgi:hypothetical protein
LFSPPEIDSISRLGLIHDRLKHTGGARRVSVSFCAKVASAKSLSRKTIPLLRPAPASALCRCAQAITNSDPGATWIVRVHLADGFQSQQKAVILDAGLMMRTIAEVGAGLDDGNVSHYRSGESCHAQLSMDVSSRRLHGTRPQLVVAWGVQLALYAARERPPPNGAMQRPPVNCSGSKVRDAVARSGEPHVRRPASGKRHCPCPTQRRQDRWMSRPRPSVCDRWQRS